MGAVEPTSDHAARQAAAAAARRTFFGTLGVVEHEPLQPLLRPAAMVQQRWPSPPRWRVIRRGSQTAIASDALSDPWPDERGPGWGLELFMQTDEALPIVVGSWLADAIEQLSHIAAAHGSVRPMLDQHGPIVVEIDGRALPAELRNARGRAGLLLGAASDELPPWFTLPEGRARLVAAVLLTRSELEHLTGAGQPGRDELARRVSISPTGLRSRRDRPSLL